MAAIIRASSVSKGRGLVGGQHRAHGVLPPRGGVQDGGEEGAALPRQRARLRAPVRPGRLARHNATRKEP